MKIKGDVFDVFAPFKNMLPLLQIKSVEQYKTVIAIFSLDLTLLSTTLKKFTLVQQ
jgi:hypothetical protein